MVEQCPSNGILFLEQLLTSIENGKKNPSLQTSAIKPRNDLLKLSKKK